MKDFTGFDDGKPEPLTCTAEAAGYDGMFGVYCNLPRGHDGPHRDSYIEWDYVDTTYRNQKDESPEG